MSSATTKAGDWFAARQQGRRLPEHEQCDECGEITGTATFDDIANRWICQPCIELRLEQTL